VKIIKGDRTNKNIFSYGSDRDRIGLIAFRGGSKRGGCKRYKDGGENILIRDKLHRIFFYVLVIVTGRRCVFLTHLFYEMFAEML
jgi:hypothetical protein